MKKIYTVLAVVLSLPFPFFFSSAQGLPSLPDDPSVTKGAFPDGVSYYMVTNGTRKGVADLALVWRLGHGVHDLDTAACADFRDSIDFRGMARDFLRKTSLFSSRSPESFLRAHGIANQGCGYVESTDDAVIFMIHDFDISRGGQVMDSLLLLTFDIVRGYSDSLRKAGVPDFGQAVMISGDIDRNAVAGKMEMLSLFVPATMPQVPPDSYSWEPGDSLCAVTVHEAGNGTATVYAEYSLPRVPRDYMATVLPLVSSQLGNEMGLILKKRLAKGLRRKGIPVAGIGYSFKGSTQWCGDEKYTLSVTISPEDVKQVVPVMSEVLSQLSSGGTSLKEYAGARLVVARQLERNAGAFLKSNASYIDRCISSYLYGSSLSSQSDRYSFFGSTALADSSGRRFFNRFASSLLDSTDNLVLRCVSDSVPVSPEEMKDLFVSGWKAPSEKHSFAVNIDDTTGFEPVPFRCKVRKTAKEPLSGGEMWTFANGLKVIYRQMPAGGKFWYSFIIRGGFSSVPDLMPGEGAFFSDMLGLYDICGVKSDDVRYLLSAKDIVMRGSVGVSDMRISGSAPSVAFPFLVKTLLGIVNSRAMDTEAFDYYAECERLRLEAASGSRLSRYVAIDSILCPGYRYSVFKSLQGLTPDVQKKADRFFSEQFRKANDGVLVVVGELDADHAKKMLSEYAGGFGSAGKSIPRTSYSYQPISGESTYTLCGESSSLDIAMSASLQLSNTNYMAAKIASYAVRDAVLDALDGMAFSLSVSDSFTVIPRERYSMILSAEACSPDGFSSETTAFNPLKSIFVIRAVLSDLSSRNISDSDLAMYKTSLKNSLESRQADPEYWVDVISRRFADSKDLHTDYSAKIDDVTADQVRSVIAALNGSGKVEYAVISE